MTRCFVHHRRAVAQTCAATGKEWQNSIPRSSETIEPIDTKFKTGDCVRDTTPCGKFRVNPFIGGFSANG